jgi:hypothetical protein
MPDAKTPALTGTAGQRRLPPHGCIVSLSFTIAQRSTGLRSRLLRDKAGPPTLVKDIRLRSSCQIRYSLQQAEGRARPIDWHSTVPI